VNAARPWLAPFLLTVVAIQGLHVIEHIIQLLQVFVIGVPDDEALGLLGYAFQVQGTEEWLHLVFNASYLIALYVLLFQLSRLTPWVIPAWAFWAFVIWGVGLETWHMVEHIVIIAHVLQHSGCPCPGIGDAALGVSDTVLHFFYNGLSFTGLLIAAAYVLPPWFEGQRTGFGRLRLQ
jgi:hypothetical protein